MLTRCRRGLWLLDIYRGMVGFVIFAGRVTFRSAQSSCKIRWSLQPSGSGRPLRGVSRPLGWSNEKTQLIVYYYLDHLISPLSVLGRSISDVSLIYPALTLIENHSFCRPQNATPWFCQTSVQFLIFLYIVPILNSSRHFSTLGNKTVMANRGPTLDPNVFTICDLERHGAKKLPKAYRGEFHRLNPLGLGYRGLACAQDDWPCVRIL